MKLNYVIFFLIGIFIGNIRIVKVENTLQQKNLAVSHGWQPTQAKFGGGTVHVDQHLATAKLSDGREAMLVIQGIDPVCVKVKIRTCTDDGTRVIRYGESLHLPDPSGTKDRGWLNIEVERGEIYPQISMERIGPIKL